MSERALLKSDDISVFIGLAQEGSTSYIITGIELILEDGRSLTLVNIPVDVANAIKALRGDIDFPRRESLFDLLANYEAFKDELARTLKKVIIDELDMTTGLYTATVEFEDEGMVSEIKMIPSHAIFLALLTGAPIYVSKELVDLEESLDRDEDEEDK